MTTMEQDRRERSLSYVQCRSVYISGRESMNFGRAFFP
jgi:hypothetical protein